MTVWIGSVDDAAEDLLPPYRGVEGYYDVKIVVGRVLVETILASVPEQPAVT
jgi:hypothetical protein